MGGSTLARSPTGSYSPLLYDSSCMQARFVGRRVQAKEHEASQRQGDAGYLGLTFERSKSALPSRKSSAMTQPMENMSCSMTTLGQRLRPRLMHAVFLTTGIYQGQESAYHLRLELLRGNLLQVAAAALIEALRRDVAAPAAPGVKVEGEVRLHTVACLSGGCWSAQCHLIPPWWYKSQNKGVGIAKRTLWNTYCVHCCRICFWFTLLQVVDPGCRCEEVIKISSVLKLNTLRENWVWMSPGCLQGGMWACMMQSRQGTPSSMM